MDLGGKVALVTGGARRIGRAIVESLAGRGARVAVHFGASAQEAEEVGHRTGGETFQADLRDPAAASELPLRVIERMGRLDILVNSAAVMLRQPFGTVAPEAWNAVLDLNLRAAFFITQSAASELRRTRGVVVNISDVAAHEPWPEYLPHSISKAGIEMLTRGLARILAPEVRVNAVAPGPVLLPEGWSAEATRRTIHATPLGRLGQPGDVTAAVTYLLDAAYVTGTVLVVDGGQLMR